MKYPKLQTYWNRTDKGKIIIGEVSRKEFLNIKKWVVTEKIDGTNIRIMLRGDKVIIGSRNHDENSKQFGMHKGLLKHLKETFTYEKLSNRFEGNATLFGEGYGANIQKGGGNYREDQGFILFDVVIHDINHNWWLERDSLEDITKSFEIPIVPIIFKDIYFSDISVGLQSVISQRDMIAEGVIARTEPLMFFRNGNPIMFKLKTRDFEGLE